MSQAALATTRLRFARCEGVGTDGVPSEKDSIIVHRPTLVKNERWQM
jgi:hypothetical protein